MIINPPKPTIRVIIRDEKTNQSRSLSLYGKETIEEMRMIILKMLRRYKDEQKNQNINQAS